VKKNNYKKPGALAPDFKNKLIKILRAQGIQTYSLDLGPDTESIESITYRPQATGGKQGNRQQAAGYRRQAAGSKQSRISDQEAASGRVGPQAASSWTEEPG